MYIQSCLSFFIYDYKSRTKKRVSEKIDASLIEEVQPSFFFFEKEEKYINGNVRPEGQTEQHEIWQEEQTPSKPLTEMNV